jgi:hypothetical protein
MPINFAERLEIPGESLTLLVLILYKIAFNESDLNPFIYLFILL